VLRYTLGVDEKLVEMIRAEAIVPLGCGNRPTFRVHSPTLRPITAHDDDGRVGVLIADLLEQFDTVDDLNSEARDDQLRVGIAEEVLGVTPVGSAQASVARREQHLGDDLAGVAGAVDNRTV